MVDGCVPGKAKLASWPSVPTTALLSMHSFVSTKQPATLAGSTKPQQPPTRSSNYSATPKTSVSTQMAPMAINSLPAPKNSWTTPLPAPTASLLLDFSDSPPSPAMSVTASSQPPSSIAWLNQRHDCPSALAIFFSLPQAIHIRCCQHGVLNSMFLAVHAK